MQQVGLGGADRDGAEAEGNDRAVARAGAEYRMTLTEFTSVSRPAMTMGRDSCHRRESARSAGRSRGCAAPIDRRSRLPAAMTRSRGAACAWCCRAIRCRQDRDRRCAAGERAGSAALGQRHHARAASRRSDGVHYHFRDQAEFDRMVAAGELLEWARVLGRHCYGTPRAPVEEALRDGKDMVFDIDWQGHRQLRDGVARRRRRRLHPAADAGRAGAAPAPPIGRRCGGDRTSHAAGARRDQPLARNSTTWW